MNKMLMTRGMVALAGALSITMAIAAAVARAWPLIPVHAFISLALLSAYLRPMDVDILDEVQRRHK